MLAVLLLCEMLVVVASKSTQSLEEDCFCPKIQKKLTEIEEKLLVVLGKAEEWMPYIPVVHELRQTVELQENAIRELKEKIQSPALPVPEALIMKPEVNEQEINLLKKVEMMENLTMEVQEELESERRVRRHLEEDLNETRYSIKTLGDRLQNVTLPVEAQTDYVELVVLSTLDTMNVTSLGDNLQKLYYKVDGVAYKNETRHLDERLDVVEGELQGVSNSSAILRLEQELEALSNKLHFLNSSLEDMWRLKEAQLHETVRANRREDLQELENGLNYLRKEVLVLQNKSVFLDTAILAEKDREFEQSSLLKNLSVETDALKSEMDRLLSVTSKLQTYLQILSADLASIENRFENLNEAVSSGLYLQDMESKIQNLTEEWRNALAFLAAEIEELKQQTAQSHDTTIWKKEDGEEDIDLDISRLRIGGLKNTPCRLPNITESHIQVTSKFDNEGQEHLVFSCRPIGMYALIQPPVPWRCVEGTWRGSFPTCRRLLNEVEVNELANQVNKEFRCSDTEVPDPTDCAFFFKCSHGKSDRMKCPSNLHFDSNKRRCEYQINARCSSVLPSGAIETLQTLTPAIWIGRPNISQNHTVDEQFSLMGTGSAGELVVYPRTTFTLQCLFPESVWGIASWYVRYSDSDSSVKMSNVRTRKSHVAVTLTAAKEEHSGTYTCRTPFGVEHSIVVNITAVQCPEISYGDVKYIRFPDAEDRILSTVARFPCKKELSAICLPNGSWSRGPPTSEECAHEKKIDDETKWRCPPIDTKHRPGLILDEDMKQNIVKFKCSSNLILDGEAITRCVDGEWTYSELPRCMDK